MLYFLSALFGLLFGSFAGALIVRLPRGETPLNPVRSHCPACGRTLTAADLVPVLSFLFLKGRCRACGAKLSRRYPAAELLTASLFCAALWRTGVSYTLIPVWGLCFCLVCLGFIDADTQTLPDPLTLAAALCGLVYAALLCAEIQSPAPLWQGLLGATIAAAPLWLTDFFIRFFAKKDAFGLGDVKLMAACGLFLPPGGAGLALLLAVLSGGLIGAALLVTGRIKRGGYMPFGPFLALGTLVSLWFGHEIVGWYLRLFH